MIAALPRLQDMGLRREQNLFVLSPLLSLLTFLFLAIGRKGEEVVGGQGERESKRREVLSLTPPLFSSDVTQGTNSPTVRKV